MHISNVINKNLLKNRWVVASGVGVLGVAAGAGIGYVVVKKVRQSRLEVGEPDNGQLVLDYDGVSSDDEVVERPPPVVLKEKVPDRILEQEEVADRVLTDYTKAAEALAEPDEDETEDISDDEELDESEDSEDSEDPEIQNIFANSGEGWDYEEERKRRNPELPYIIHQDEYFRDEGGRQQHTLTWYEGDDVLVDESDKPVYNHHDVVGELKFGHGSNDANVVYIRNERMRSEYEVLRHTGHFAEEILGLHQEVEIENELQHSDRVRRFRSSD